MDLQLSELDLVPITDPASPDPIKGSELNQLQLSGSGSGSAIKLDRTESSDLCWVKDPAAVETEPVLSGSLVWFCWFHKGGNKKSNRFNLQPIVGTLIRCLATAVTQGAGLGAFPWERPGNVKLVIILINQMLFIYHISAAKHFKELYIINTKKYRINNQNTTLSQ